MKELTNRPEYFIGIDIAKKSFTVAIYKFPEEPIIVKEGFENSVKGFRDFIKWLSGQKIEQRNSIICMEETGVYSEHISYFLYSKDFPVALETPSKIKQMSSQWGSKTEKLDAKRIAEYAYRYYDKLNLFEPNSKIFEQIKALLTTREFLTEQKTANKNALQAFKLKHVQTPLVNSIYEQNIDNLQVQIDEIDKAIAKLIDKDKAIKHRLSLLKSIPGVGTLLALNLIVFTNNFSITLDPRQLASFLGVCPHKFESGTSVYRRPHSSGCGPGRVRKLLYLAAISLRAHNPHFKQYFLRKTAQGKHNLLVINNIINKLLKIICAVVRTNTAFIKDYVSVNPSLVKNS